MLRTIYKMSESIISGPGSSFQALDMSSDYCVPLRELGIRFSGISIRKPPYRMIRGDNEPHHFMILFVLEGKVSLKTSERDFILEAGTFVNIPSWIPRKFELIEGDQYKLFLFRIEDRVAQDALKVRKLVVRPSVEIVEMFASLRALYNESLRSNMDMQLAWHYASTVAILLKRELADLKINTIDENQKKLSKLYLKINKQPNYPWTVEKMAHTVYLSKPYLYKITRKYYNVSPMQMVTGIRVEHSKKLLSCSDCSLQEIADIVGFANEYSFSNAFKRHTGVRPGKFRLTNGFL